jgi:hypothetical protein
MPSTTATATWGGPEVLARLETHNAAVRRVRCRIEKMLGTCKRSYGLRLMRWLELAPRLVRSRSSITRRWFNASHTPANPGIPPDLISAENALILRCNFS